MGKNSFTFNFRRWPKSFLGACVIILCLEMGVLLVERFHHLHQNGLSIQLKNQLAQESNQSYDVLVLGDCYHATGIDPKIIGKKTGLTTYNFSVAADPTIVLPYTLFAHYLKNNDKKPKHIILGYVPQTMAYTEDYVKKKLLPYFYYYRHGNIPFFIKEFGLKEGLKFMMPSLAYQGLIQRGFLGGDLRSKEDAKRVLDDVYIRGGFNSIQEQRTYAMHVKGYAGSVTFKQSDFFDQHMRAILDLAYEHNIQVVYVIPSTTPDWYVLYEQSGLLSQNKAIVENWKKDYPNMIIVDPQNELMGNQFYANHLHLNRQGADALSHIVSQTLINKR